MPLKSKMLLSTNVVLQSYSLTPQVPVSGMLRFKLLKQ